MLLTLVTHLVFDLHQKSLTTQPNYYDNHISLKKDTEQIAYIVREANKDVANLFVITLENTSKHPSFYSTQWLV